MHTIILKNDAVGDLTHSLDAIKNLIECKNNEKITIFLSKLNKDFSFLFKSKYVEIKVLNYNLTILEKVKLIFFLLKNRTSKVIILTPKKFYFYLPIFFKKIKFYALCLDNINNYKRPSKFLRRFLHKYEVNPRDATFKRPSTRFLQSRLTNVSEQKKDLNKIDIFKLKELNDQLPKDYIYFHLKKKIFDGLGWGIDELKVLTNEFLKYSKNVILTKDIEVDANTKLLKKNFNFYDFLDNSFVYKSSKVFFLDNAYGEDLYNVILNSKKVVAFHGMMTNLASIEKKSVLDLYYCKIKDWEDYRKYRNSFYEFKPRYDKYDFIIPSKDIKKTLRKMKFSLEKINA